MMPTSFIAISIHAPLTGSDCASGLPLLIYNQFQSTLPSQGATLPINCAHFRYCISIHAPLTGSDAECVRLYIHFTNFNPRSPHRERHCLCFLLVIYSLFQSTLPSQGATAFDVGIAMVTNISIHAPLTGSDAKLHNSQACKLISIHAPLTGSDSKYTHKIPL